MKERAPTTLASLLGLLLAGAVAAWILAAQKPPEPVPATAPDREFSAERAMAHVERLGAAPRPLGTTAHSDARAYLLERLAELGFETEVQEEDVVTRRAVDQFAVIRTRNVLGRLPGRAPTGALLLAAHYDSRPNTPGAGDALAGVAAILEAVRAATAGPFDPGIGASLENDVIVLFSDAEELGLVGARAFVDRHPWASSVRLVVNLEARGNRGPAAMFETRAGNGAVIRALAKAVPEPYASSMSYEVYRRMPNDTDFTVFRRAGVQGLNIAPVGNLAAYHTMLDRPANLSRATLQHHGSYALGLVRHFGNSDLAAIPDESAPDAVYFNPYPWKLVVYPATWALPLAGGSALLLFAAIAVCIRRKRATLGGVGRGLVIFVVTLASAGIVGWCLWWVIRVHLSGILFGPYARPYEVELMTGSLVLLVLALTGALFAWLRDARTGAELWSGAWLGFMLLNFAAALWVPGASYLTTWPLVAGALGVMALGLLPESRWQPLVPALAALPAIVLWAPTGWAVAEALTLAAAAAIATVAALLVIGLAPLLGAMHRATAGWWSTALAAAGLGIVVWVVVQAQPTPERPGVDTLVYAVDTDTGEAWWASLDDEPDAWTSLQLGEVPQRDWAPDALALGDTKVLFASADPVVLDAPVSRTLSDSRARGRSVSGVVSSTRGAEVLRIRAETSVPLHAVSVEGERFEFEGDPEAEGLGEVWITAHGFGSDGVEVGFELEDAWPVELDLVDMSWGFGALPEPPEPRPDHFMPSPSWRTDAVYVRRSTLM